MSPSAGSVTLLLQQASAGRPEALDDVLPVVYDELQRLARAVRHGGPGRTLATTDLVHEAYFRLVRTDGVDWDGRRHFFRVAARAMRQVLVADARRRQAAKRGGGRAAVTLLDDVHGGPPHDAHVLDLHEALERLAALDTRQAAVVELRYFGGLSIEETAETLGVSVPTVNRDWRVARIWLARALAP